MPFTPLHLGPAAVLKAVAGPHFSFMVFGGTQVLMDIEPLVRIVRGDTTLHGITHTFLGATGIALLAAFIGGPITNLVLRWWNSSVSPSSLLFARELPVRRHAVWIAAFVGAWSHVALDGLMHADMQPLWPWRLDNPWLHAIPVGRLHQICFITAALGGLACVALAMWRRHRRA
jgi:membrane-bound metal-dependent hydrolase YbcI (DUF457 family)